MNKHFLQSQCDMGTSPMDLNSILRELGVEPTISTTIDIKCSESCRIKLKCICKSNSVYYWEVI
jgi:hypothetical protein